MDTLKGEIHEVESQLMALFGDHVHPSEAVIHAMIEHEDYARNVMIARDSPGLLNVLLQNPPAVSSPLETNGQVNHGSPELIHRAVRAFSNWAKTGFSIVSLETLKKREDACLRCEHLGKPERFVQRLMTSKSADAIGARAADGVCKLCGCSIGRKIRLSSESCPAVAPEDHKLTRWGEPAA